MKSQPRLMCITGMMSVCSRLGRGSNGTNGTIWRHCYTFALSAPSHLQTKSTRAQRLRSSQKDDGHTSCPDEDLAWELQFAHAVHSLCSGAQFHLGGNASFVPLT